MIDLHVHTDCSDGSNTWKEILTMAEEKGVKYLSITDHNTCEAYNQMEKQNIRKYYNGKLITGVELTTKALGIVIELLGYGINTQKINEKLKQLYSDFEKEKTPEKEGKALCESCRKIGIDIKDEVIEEAKK